MEYRIKLPGLVQHKGTQRILLLNQEKTQAVDACGSTYHKAQFEPIPHFLVVACVWL